MLLVSAVMMTLIAAETATTKGHPAPRTTLCGNACENPNLPRSFDVTDVVVQPVGGTAKWARLWATFRWRGTGPAPQVTVDPFFIGDQGFPIGGGQGRTVFPVNGVYKVEVHPSTNACNPRLGGFLILTARWNGDAATEGHLVRFALREPSTRCTIP